MIYIYNIYKCIVLLIDRMDGQDGLKSVDGDI